MSDGTVAVEALRRAQSVLAGPDPSDPWIRIEAALETIRSLGSIDGAHHKQYVLDQVVRLLTGCVPERKTAFDYKRQIYNYDGLNESDEYKKWVAETKAGEEGPETYGWSEGTPP